MTPGLSDEFDDLETGISTEFIPIILGQTDIAPELRALTALPVKHAGLALPNPTTTANQNYQASTLICSHLISAIRGHSTFSSHTHQQTLTAGKAELVQRKQASNDKELDLILQSFPDDTKQSYRRGKETGSWLSLTPSILNGTHL